MGTKRYFVLDGIRGFALLNMLAYHCIWDIVYLFDFDWAWYRSEKAWLWQQGICWTFIFLSGFCYPLGHRKWKRGLIVFGWGLVISAVTWAAVPEARVSFGILTLIGFCMMALSPAERFLRKVSPAAGMLLCTGLFLITRNVNEGFLGFGSLWSAALPQGWYANFLTAFLGFPEPGFYSADYFSLIPWSFLFLAGFFAYRLMERRNALSRLEPRGAKPLEWLGRHSLEIYVVHQPLIYLLLFLLLRI